MHVTTTARNKLAMAAATVPLFEAFPFPGPTIMLHP